MKSWTEMTDEERAEAKRLGEIWERNFRALWEGSGLSEEEFADALIREAEWVMMNPMDLSLEETQRRIAKMAGIRIPPPPPPPPRWIHVGASSSRH